MATTNEVKDAIAAVKAGNANDRQRKLVEDRSNTVDPYGRRAHDALDESTKDKSKSWGNW